MAMALQVENLSKRYESVVAVEGLDVRVERGELYAFLGLNGAGKSYRATAPAAPPMAT